MSLKLRVSHRPKMSYPDAYLVYYTYYTINTYLKRRVKKIARFEGALEDLNLDKVSEILIFEEVNYIDKP